jgi:hypothetical protein
MLRLRGCLVHKPGGLVLPLLGFGRILNNQLLCSDVVHGNRREFVLSLRSRSLLRSLRHVARVLAPPVLLPGLR